MLCFPPEIERESPHLGTAAEAAVIVESAFVWPSVVIDDGLAEMEAVAQRSAADATELCVDALQFCARRRPIQAAFDIGLELLHKCSIDRLRFFISCIGLNALGASLQHVCDAQARPGPQTEES